MGSQKVARPPLTFADRRALLALSLVNGVGWARVRLLVDRFESPVGVMAASRRELAEVDGIGIQTADAVARFDDYDVVDRQLERADLVGANMMTLWDGEYPPPLKELYDAPPFLWVRGRMPDGESMRASIAVVGTRRPSEYGKRYALEFAHGLASAGLIIVSGLAYGIDAIAHRAALEAGGCTIAVMGSGVDRIYPGSHRQLASRMMENGALVSEFPLGAAPEAMNFPRRNRIISGLAKGTLVVEAYEDGGALITAKLALEQSREVFAIPGPINSKSSAGANMLIRDSGAKLVTCIEDILVELGPQLRPVRIPAVEPVTLDPIERKLFDALGDAPRHIDQICHSAGIESATALVHLLGLELKGLVCQAAGKQFYLSHPIQG